MVYLNVYTVLGLLIPWSMVALILGMAQAHRDWRDPREAVRTARGAHAFESARRGGSSG